MIIKNSREKKLELMFMETSRFGRINQKRANGVAILKVENLVEDGCRRFKLIFFCITKRQTRKLVKTRLENDSLRFEGEKV